MNKKPDIESAILYRIVCNYNIEIANSWGYKPNSEGFKEAKRKFNEKYDFLNFEEFYQEIVISFIAKELIKYKKSDYKVAVNFINRDIDDLLKSPEMSKLIKNNFNKLNKNYSDYHNINKIQFYRENIKLYYGDLEIAELIVRLIDEQYEKLLDVARQRKKIKECFNQLDYAKLMLIQMYLNDFWYETDNKDKLVEAFNLENYIDSEEFIEKIYLNTKKQLEILKKNAYNKEKITIFREKISLLRLDNKLIKFKSTEAEDGKKRKLKEDFFDKLEKSSLGKITTDTIEEGIEILQSLYDEYTESNDYNSILNYYYLEEDYNILMYMVMAANLSEINYVEDVDDENLKNVGQIAVFDNVIFRNKIIGQLINDINNNIKNKELLTKINELQSLKYKIIEEMPSYEREVLIEFLKSYIEGKEYILKQVKHNVENFKYYMKQLNKSSMPKYVSYLKKLLKLHSEIIKMRYKLMK